MAYIGRQPTVGNFQICDAISVVNGQAAYTMQVGSVNVLPETANHMIVSLNGVIQKPNSSFTVSGSTITFSSNLATGDVIDFIQILGDVLDLGVPSDATVTTAKLANSAVDLTSKVTGALPIANGGTALTSGFANGITNAQQWRISGNQTGLNEGAFVTNNWEETDTDGYGRIGSLMTQSSGEFTFPATGRWLIHFVFVALGGNQTQQYVGGKIQTTSNNSSYSVASEGYNTHGIANSYSSTCNTFLFAVSDTTTHKVKFSIAAQQNGVTAIGSTANNMTSVTFTRLGDI